MNVTIKSTDTIYSMHPAQEDVVVYNLKHAFKISIKQQQTNCKQQQQKTLSNGASHCNFLKSRQAQHGTTSLLRLVRCCHG